MQQIFTVERLETTNVWNCYLIENLSNSLIFCSSNIQLIQHFQCYNVWFEVSEFPKEKQTKEHIQHLNCVLSVFLLWTLADKSQTLLETRHNTHCFACTWNDLWISALAVGDISYQKKVVGMRANTERWWWQNKRSEQYLDGWYLEGNMRKWRRVK